MPTDYRPQFEVVLDDDAALDDHLLVGFASPGMASLVAVDHLRTTVETSQVGHVHTENVPTITAFTEGEPRHPIRLYETDIGVSLLVSEIVHPVGVSDRFADGLWDAAVAAGVGDVTLLYGVPYPHGPDEHAVFTVATADYPTDPLRAAGVEPMTGGFLDGLPGRLLDRGLEEAGPSVGVYITPAHPPGPDFDGAIRLLDALGEHLDREFETADLEARSAELQQYYTDLAERMAAVGPEDRDPMEDRMYM